jgi:hypothetical protein
LSMRLFALCAALPPFVTSPVTELCFPPEEISSQALSSKYSCSAQHSLVFLFKQAVRLCQLIDSTPLLFLDGQPPAIYPPSPALAHYLAETPYPAQTVLKQILWQLEYLHCLTIFLWTILQFRRTRVWRNVTCLRQCPPRVM